MFRKSIQNHFYFSGDTDRHLLYKVQTTVAKGVIKQAF